MSVLTLHRRKEFIAIYGRELPKTGFSGLIYATVAAALGLAGVAMRFAAHLRNR
jgi:hypothetical protein